MSMPRQRHASRSSRSVESRRLPTPGCKFCSRFRTSSSTSPRSLFLSTRALGTTCATASRSSRKPSASKAGNSPNSSHPQRQALRARTAAASTRRCRTGRTAWMPKSGPCSSSTSSGCPKHRRTAPCPRSPMKSPSRPCGAATPQPKPVTASTTSTTTTCPQALSSSRCPALGSRPRLRRTPAGSSTTARLCR
eukprot:Amastigsp_a678384_49.p3 type:complete len:193 gc:universal Amastigsp_a678384_49:278-856(+)